MIDRYPTGVEEIWKMIPAPEFKGLYEASSFGRIRRAAPGRYTYPGRILKTPCNSSGYPHLALWNGELRKYFLAHQLVALAFLGPCPFGHEVNHKDGVKTNNKIDNLEYVTPSGNCRHALTYGLNIPPHGEQHFRAKLTEQDVCDIREALTKGESLRSLGRKYGVHATTIRNIGLRINWKHI